MKKKIIIGLIALGIVSCDKNDNPSNIEEHLVVTETVDNKVSEQVLFEGTSVYGNFFAYNAPIVGFSSLKQNSLTSEELTVISPLETETQLKSASINGFSISINGIELNQNQLQTKSASLDGQDELLAQWYGQDIEFVIKSTTMLKSGSLQDENDTVSMYMPELVCITSPEIQTEEELYPYCYYDGFELHWTADERNDNGVVVMVEWLGSVVGEDNSGQYVRNIDVLPDNGKAILNSKIFDNIPDKAYAYLTILRGNIDLIDIDDTSYRILGESHEVLPMVLIKNIEE